VIFSCKGFGIRVYSPLAKPAEQLRKKLSFSTQDISEALFLAVFSVGLSGKEDSQIAGRDGLFARLQFFYRTGPRLVANHCLDKSPRRVS
jgi:hypothetical protein